MLRKALICLAIVPALACVGHRSRSAPAEEIFPVVLLASEAIDPDALLADVLWLADEAREGRGLGSAGLEEAGAWLASRLAELGLEPLFEVDGEASFFQPFKVPIRASRGETTAIRAGSSELAPDQFELLEFTGAGDASAPLVFAGHGISAPEAGHDDYADLDVRGAIVLVLNHAPGEKAGRLPPEFAAHAGVLRKLTEARRRGAVGFLLAPDAHQHLADDALPPPRPLDIKSRSIPAARLTGAAAQILLGEPLTQSNARPRPLDRTIRFVASIEEEATATRNVCGRVRGADSRRAGESILVGAHYDHLGLGDENSMDPRRVGELHPGADDNASGTAAALAIARSLSTRPAARSVVVCFFSGEEQGLWGSQAFVNAPPFPVEEIAAMINLDMVGRLDDGALTVFGFEGHHPVARGLAGSAVGEIPLEFGGRPPGPSDHVPFADRGVQTVFFFTGLHDQYHLPDDTPERLDVAGLARVVRVAAGLVHALGDADPLPVTRARASLPP